MRLVLLRYARSEELLRVELSCHLPGSGGQTGSATETGVIALDVDELIARGIRHLRDAIGECPEPQAVEVATVPPSPAIETAVKLAVIVDSLAPLPGPTPAVAPEILQPVRASRFQDSVGVAPFFTTGGLVPSASVYLRR